MTSFLAGVFSSIVASLILFVVGGIMSRQVQHWPVRLLSRLTGLGIHRVYRRQKDAEPDISQDLAEASWLVVLAGRGNALTRDAFLSLWSGTVGRMESARILLPDHEVGPDSWLDRREEDLRRTDPGYSEGLLSAQVGTNTAYLAEVAQKHPVIELRNYNLPNLGRVVATDKAAYVTFYGHGEHGRHSPCFYARSPSVLYDVAMALFSVAWRDGTPTTGEPK